MGKFGEVRGVRDKAPELLYIVVMFKIDTKEIVDLEHQLKTFADRAFPFATKQTINSMAFEGQKLIKTGIGDTMIERNKFTRNSIRVEQSKTLNVNKQSSIVGSTADYMDDQEFGGIKYKSGKEGTPIATSYAAGQGMNSGKRTRLPRRANTLQNIQLRRQRTKGRNRKQRMVLAVRDAVESGNRYIFLKMKRKKGIFRVIGGKRGTKRGWPGNAQIRMVHDLTEQSVRIPKNPTFAPAVKRVETMMPAIYRKALIFQLKRNKLFR